MKNSYRRHLLLFTCILIFSILFCGCSAGLSSSNYWKGVEKESEWVEKKYKPFKLSAIENSSENSQDLSQQPVPAFLKNEGQKFRIGIVISGDYWEFFENLKGLIEGFSSIGWANRISVPSSFSHCDELISWLNGKKYSDYIEFVPEYFVNVNWGDNTDELIEKYFTYRPSVDVVITYGGKASKTFYDMKSYPIPVFSDAITDCSEAGVTLSDEDSGKDFFSNKIDPEIFKQQIRLFHDMVGFKNLGIIYGNNADGILYGAVNDVEAVARERYFDIVRDTNVKEFMDDDTPDLYLAALRRIVDKVDAVYIGASTAVTEYNIMPQIVEILNKSKKPSFSLEGTIRVKDGILFSLSSSGLTRSGIWMATKISHAFSGESPRSLSQHFENMYSVAVNLDTAKKIGFKMPLDLLVNSDEFYIDVNGSIVQYGSDMQSAGSRQSLSPKKRNDSKKYKIAVVESGDGNYWEFTEHLKGIINGLRTNRWIKQNLDLSNAHTVNDIYQVLANEDYSDYLEFVPEYFVKLGWGSHSDRINMLFADEKPDIDLIIGLGGVAGKILSKQEKYKIPVLLDAITDPVGSGIVYSVSDSGKSFLTCRVDQTQYQRQIQLFKEFTGFKKLGIVYGDDEYGRLYGAVGDVELMSLKLNFDIVRNTDVKESVAKDTVDLYLKALKDVCSQCDAVYIGASTAVTEYDIMPQIVNIIQEAGIPSFALEGDIRVKKGILMGVSSLESEKIGLYNADKIASIFYGTTPRLLKQEFVGVPSIALNIDMADKIGMDIPLSTLATVDQIYGGPFN
ncbi:MAG: hypothetical protein K6G00_08765 [Treponema sp.]|nr:hypothetical protein [Treponema sp.]